MTLAVVVPTRNRPHELATLLANLAEQTRWPDCVTVVDGSDEEFCPEIRRLVATCGLACRYLRHWPPSAAAQRNAGLDAVLPACDLVALIDDDLTLNPEAFEIACRASVDLGDEFVGLGFNPTEEGAKVGYGALKATRLAKSLGLYSNRVGAITPSGWHTRLLFVNRVTEVDWLLSGAVVWRASAIGDLRFDEFFEEYSYLEDLEFSLQARRRGRFAILPEATYLHVPAEGGRKSRFWFGRIEIRNRYYIVKKHGLSRWRFWLGAGIRAAMTLGGALVGRGEDAGRLRGNLAEISSMIGKRTRAMLPTGRAATP
tara:strand:- start:893 stop:1834 length:942 start_codon:yes stop_codon:yes gene_type:complete